MQLSDAVEAIEWRCSRRVCDHQYIIDAEHPDFFKQLNAALRASAFIEKYRKCLYKVAFINGFKYWRMGSVINRKPMTEEEAGKVAAREKEEREWHERMHREVVTYRDEAKSVDEFAALHAKKWLAWAKNNPLSKEVFLGEVKLKDLKEVEGQPTLSEVFEKFTHDTIKRTQAKYAKEISKKIGHHVKFEQPSKEDRK